MVGVDGLGHCVLAHDRGGLRLVDGDRLHSRRTGRPTPSASAWRLALAPGLAFGANIALFFTAITKTSIAHAEFITALTPLVLLPAGAFFFGERPNWPALRWGLISIVGVSLVLFFGPARVRHPCLATS